MARTKPPCHDGIDDCPRRYVGCHAECDRWHEWLAIHEAEKKRANDNKKAEHELLAIVATHGERLRRTKRAIYDAKRRGYDT